MISVIIADFTYITETLKNNSKQFIIVHVKMEDEKMMKFFRKHRKAVSPVIAVMLLVAVAVAAVGAYFIWFRIFPDADTKVSSGNKCRCTWSGITNCVND